MKIFKIALAAIACMTIIGCGGHGFDGEYKMSAESDNKHVEDMIGGGTVEIGPDYMKAKGKKQTFDKISVQKSDGKKHLVFKEGDTEDMWEIVDDETLARTESQGGMEVRIVLKKTG